ncbi:MAG: NADPH:quinone oxidoreductase family protein [Silicimonas sp.]|nr:NADPH:quinone oxidoreductase family protein [Silicimonas sp.]
MTSTDAWLVTSAGAPPVRQRIRIPAPTGSEVLLRVAATGLNFADLLMIRGEYQETPPPPFVPGMEIAGVVQEVGEDVTGFRPGDRVMCAPVIGGLAGHALVEASLLRPIPDQMDDATAAGFQIAYGTSHMALTRRADLQAGETLAVLGAAGGVGLTAVEIGHQIGARVIAVARGTDKLAVAKAAGADVLIDSRETDLLQALRDHGPIDVVYDAVGGEAGNAALRALGPEGRFLVIGFASGEMPRIRPNHLLVKNQSVIGFYWGGYTKFHPQALTESLLQLVEWHASGRIRPHISHVLPFDLALDGLELLRSRKSTGKVVITQ